MTEVYAAVREFILSNSDWPVDCSEYPLCKEFERSVTKLCTSWSILCDDSEKEALVYRKVENLLQLDEITGSCKFDLEEPLVFAAKNGNVSLVRLLLSSAETKKNMSFFNSVGDACSSSRQMFKRIMEKAPKNYLLEDKRIRDETHLAQVQSLASERFPLVFSVFEEYATTIKRAHIQALISHHGRRRSG